MTNPKPLSPEERVEAAAREMANVEWQSLGGEARRFLRLDAELVLKAAFPEYFAGTHVLLPREPTEEMVEALVEHGRYNDDFSDGSAEMWNAYLEMISAYESTSTSTEEK